MNISQAILLGFLLTFHSVLSSAVEVKWVDDTATWDTAVPSDLLPDYTDYTQLCTAGAPQASSPSNNGLARCFGYCYGSDTSSCAACKTYGFYKVGPLGAVSGWNHGRRCYINNDLDMVEHAFDMRVYLRCGPTGTHTSWSNTGLAPEVYHLKYCAPKVTENPKGAAGCSGPSLGHPISIGYGNKFLQETDYQYAAGTHMHYKRTYNSFMSYLDAGQSKEWMSSSFVSLIVNGNEVYAKRSDRKLFKFTQSGTNWKSDADIKDKLFKLLNASNVHIGWQYIVAANDTVEIYDDNGRLLNVSDKAGNKVSYTLSTSATPKSIAVNPSLPVVMTDQVGRVINFIYDGADRIKTMINPQGGVYTYDYDAHNNLVSITYPDNVTKTYHYGEAVYVSSTPDAGVSNVNLLTGITDENGNRYASYYYDNKGRAYSETLAVGADATSLVYNVNESGNPISTVVTDSLGNTRTYNFTTILGVVKSIGQTQPAGSGCAASGAALSYDVNGNVVSRTDFDGHKTLYQYDLHRNLETSRTEGLTADGLTTDATRTITTTWHDTWSLPLVISEYSGEASTGTPLKITTHSYDDRGNLTSFTESDPALNLNRDTVISYTYSSAVSGLVIGKVVDGPRTDVNDITTYNYYPQDAICTPSSAAPIVDSQTGLSPENFGCRGQLKSVKNALNQITTYNRYNHHGQVEQMTDANGLLTTMTYDLRQRLTSRTVGTKTTTLTYDNAGQVIQLRMPDNSVLNYSYDAAHRLTEVADGLGNKMIYTLDSEGNRIKEESQDSNGNLAKALTRSYDALNRLQTVTGVE